MTILLVATMFSGMVILMVKNRRQEKMKALALVKARKRRHQQRQF